MDPVKALRFYGSALGEVGTRHKLKALTRLPGLAADLERQLRALGEKKGRLAVLDIEATLIRNMRMMTKEDK